MNYYSERRKKVAEMMEDNSLLYVFSGKSIMRSYDESYPGFVDRNFFYLTGIKQLGLVLQISKIEGKVGEKLFILPYDEVLAKWVGGRIREQEATEISGIETIADVANLRDDFQNFFGRVRGSSALNLYVDIYRFNPEQDDSLGMKFAKEIRDKYLSVSIKDAYPIFKTLRQIKDEDEIAKIRTAIAITDTGIKAMMANVTDGMNEKLLEGIFNLNLSRHLATTAFGTICASGPRATILHYGTNNQPVKDGDLVLVDLGAQKDEYKADISRTFPVSGKYTERQKEIYRVVLNAQKLVERIAKPGLTIRDLQNMVVRYYEQALPLIGLHEPVNHYYFHNISHEIGLDTHDTFDRTETVLKEGMVISNEPGLYIEEEGIGIRIEDDLLITADGCENLSKDIIKEIEDIEAFMKKEA